MANFFSFIFFVLLPMAIGLLGIYLLIDFFEYLKKNHPARYQQLTYKSLFGISAESFFLHLIKPHELIRFLISPENLQDGSVGIYKKRIRLSLTALLSLFVIYSLWIILNWLTKFSVLSYLSSAICPLSSVFWPLASDLCLLTSAPRFMSIKMLWYTYR